MRGRTLAFPVERKIVLDILRAAKTVPAFPVDRWLNMSALAKARADASVRISWTAIFIRSWGLVSQQIPQLRQTYVTYPWGYLYEHPNSVASISVHRREPGSSSDSLIFCKVVEPEALSLLDIQNALTRSQREPIAEVFREGYRLARLPFPIRWFVWTLMMRIWGRKKSKMIGTFTISSLAGQNAMNRQHPLIATTSLSYSPVDAAGKCLLTLLCDHRVLDGFLATEALDRLEEVFEQRVLAELLSLSNSTSQHKLAS